MERDSLGTCPIPADAYYGIQTHRAIENSPISGTKPKAAYTDATVLVKKCAAIVNNKLGLLDDERAQAIVKACDEILEVARVVS
ncbi:MAG TPA: lyase family protein [Acidobacteriota bacterium]|nr:lyase family protein [Acidobacteriota bacterium]